MKSQVAQELSESGETPPPAAANEAGTDEDAIANGEPETVEDEDVFKEIPTVANRAKPAAVGGAEDQSTPSLANQHEAAGTYRIVHPTTSDFIDSPGAAKVDENAARRVILGPARKPR
jgi:hypothetical protein